MKTVTCKHLRQMIADVLSVNINEMRAAKEDQFFYEFDIAPTDEDIDGFIISSFCFDHKIKKFCWVKLSMKVFQKNGFWCLLQFKRPEEKIKMF